VRYGATLAMVLAAIALKLVLQDRAAGPYGFILFVPAVVAAALLFDRRSGFLALALSAGFVAASLDWHANAQTHVGALSIFLLVGGGLVLVSEGLHRALERARKAERDKDLLLQEMSHRVKNKFSMIASMINLQSREATAETRNSLNALGARVRVMAEVHNFLQLSRHDGSVNMREYLNGLCASLEQALHDLRAIHISLDADDVSLPADKALPVGLIVNELVTNAFKYAFPDDRKGTVSVRLFSDNGTLALSVSDNGAGYVEDSAAGLGTKLVTLLAAQLGGSAKWEALSPGCRVTVKIGTASQN
jgi:two-component sensor histidine kinase